MLLLCLKRHSAFSETVTEDEIEFLIACCRPFQLNEWENIYFQLLNLRYKESNLHSIQKNSSNIRTCENEKDLG